MLAVSTASANAPSATISFAGSALLESNPGSVDVTLHYSCLPPSPGDIIVSLGENGLFSGDFIPGANCDGKNHSITVTLAGVFTPGVGAGQAFVENGDGTASASASQQVDIK